MKLNTEKKALFLNEKELEESGLKTGKEYELVKAKEGIWLILEKKETEKDIEKKETEKKVLNLLKTKPLKDMVEGRFEKLLNKKELECFNQLLKKGDIIKFRLSKKYAKSIYKMKNGLTEGNQQGNQIEKNGFQVIDNENDAKNLSKRMKNEIKEKQILGVKSFDGRYYIIKRNLYELTADKIIKALKNKQKSLDDLSSEIRLNKQLIKTVCEILREQGEIIEKRKELYKLVM